MVYVIVLLIVLVVSILFVIEQRERRAIFDEQKSKGIWIARNIALSNYELYSVFDYAAAQENIEKQIDQDVIYVCFMMLKENRS